MLVSRKRRENALLATLSLVWLPNQGETNGAEITNSRRIDGIHIVKQQVLKLINPSRLKYHFTVHPGHS